MHDTIASLDSSAARRPASGLAPHPRPEVSSVPIWRRLGDRDVERCCASVLSARNSTPALMDKQELRIWL